MSQIKRIVKPVALPVSLAEAKEHMRVEYADEDDLITSYIQTAVDHLDGWTGILGRCLITQTWQMSMLGFADVKLPLPDVQSIGQISYIKTDGTTDIVDPSVYQLTDSGHVVLRSGKMWPAYSDEPDAVKIQFVCGYGDNPADVPESIRSAIKILVSGWFENRQSSDTDFSTTQIPFMVRALIEPHRSVSL